MNNYRGYFFILNHFNFESATTIEPVGNVFDPFFFSSLSSQFLQEADHRDIEVKYGIDIAEQV